MITMRVVGAERELKRLSRALGETGEQAAARLATSMGRELATTSQPHGSSKKIIQGAIERDAKRVTLTVQARDFSRLEKKKRPRLREDGRWFPVRKDQLKRSEGEVDRAIDQARDSRGRVSSRAPERMIVAIKSIFRTVLAGRRKRAGKIKGAWIGAGQDASRFQRGVEKSGIGKNFMSWAQKHSSLGSSRQSSGGRWVVLTNKADGAADLTPRGSVEKAWRYAVNKARLWYRRAVKRLEKK